MTESLGDIFVQYCYSKPAAVALQRGDCSERWSRDELRGHVVGALRKLSHLPAGSRIILALPNDYSFPTWFWACQVAGLVAVPVEPLRSGPRIGAQIESLLRIAEKAGAAACVCPGDVAEGLLGRTHFENIPSHVEALDAAIVVRPRNLEDLALIQFTSGSTGDPKGCALRQRNVKANALANIETFSLRPGDVMYNWMPYHHDMGLMAGVIVPVIGQLVSVVESPRAFILDPVGWLAKLGRLCNVHATAPNFALSLALRALQRGRSRTMDLSQVRSLFCGAEPIDPDLVRRFLHATANFGMRPETFAACYGMAEVTVLASARTGGLRTILADAEALESEGVVRSPATGNKFRELVGLGRSSVGTEIRIVDEGRHLAERFVGEVWLRSTGAMAGYYGDPVASDEVLDDDGWLMTGDNGVMVDGELFFVGRRKDILIVSGQNFDPHDIERRVAARVGLDSRRLCAVTVPTQDRRTGLAIAVEGQKALRTEGDLEGIIVGICFEITGVRPIVIRLSGQKIPRTSSGKPRRAYLAELYAKSTALPSPKPLS